MSAESEKRLVNGNGNGRVRRTTEHKVRGFRVTLENPYPNIDDRFVLGRLDAALTLIDELAPARCNHMRRDFERIWVTRYPCRGAYFPAQRVCMTEVTFLNRALEFSSAQVAASILHEGVHARIDRMRARLRFAGTWSRADEERVCRRAEVAFAHKLPADIALPILARAEPLANQDGDDEAVAPTIDWRQAQLNKLEDDLQQLDAPGWMQRSALALSRLRHRLSGG